MRLLPKNFWGIYRVMRAVLKMHPFSKDIDKARENSDFDLEKSLIRNVTKTWSEILLKDFDITVNIKNEENLPDEGPVVYICNHQSYFDVVAFFSIVKHQVGFVAKDTFGKIPLFNTWLTRIRCLYITRGDTRKSLATINLGASYIKNGYSLVIFPEGTRSKGGKMAPFKPGSFKLATKANATIIPVSINGTFNVYEGEGALTKGQSVEFVIHEPISTAGLSRPEILGLPQKVENIIKSAVITG